MKKTTYYINMNDGRVIAGTEETKSNFLYKPIDITWAIAIRDGKVSWKTCVDAINAKLGAMGFSEMMKAVAKLNVRTTDIGLENHARGTDASEDGEEQSDAGVLGQFDGAENAQAVVEKAAAAMGAPAGGSKKKTDPASEEEEAGEDGGGVNY